MKMINLKKEFGKKGIERFEEMFQSGVYDLSYRTKNNANVFHYAAALGDFNRVKELSERGADINDAEFSGNTALDYSAMAGNMEMTQWFIEKETDAQARKELIQHAMFSAARGGHLKLVQWLASQGADIFRNMSYDMSALYLAAWSGSLELVQWLVSKGLPLFVRHDFSVRPNFMRHNIMCFAAMSGNLELVQWLASQGLHVNSYDMVMGISSWDLALRSGSLELVKWMAEQKELQPLFDKNYNRMDVDVLVEAASNGYFDLLKWLNELEIFANTADSWVNNALLESVKNDNFSPEMAQWLVEHGADVNAKDRYRKTAIEYAIEQDNMECARWLDSQGATGRDNEKGDLGQRLGKRGYTFIPLNNKKDLASLFSVPKVDWLKADHSLKDSDDPEE